MCCISVSYTHLDVYKRQGKNYKFTGYWKVYTNVKETVRMFEKYKKCRDVYERLWREGRSVWQLTVAA